MLGRYGRKHTKDRDFEEEEIWGTIEDKKEMTNNNSRKPIKPKDTSLFTTTPNSPRNFTMVTTPRMIPRSSTPQETLTNGKKQSSAPLDIPDWSKIYGNKINGNYNHYVNGHYNNGVDDDDDEDEDDMMPPHEYLARKLARNQISSFSVYEGIGRTLKGRDLSKVRNAILSKTGFLE